MTALTFAYAFFGIGALGAVSDLSWRWLGAVLIGLAAALAALPGMNLIVGEWLLFSGLLRGGQSLAGLAQLALFAALVGLALASALAVACFARLTGIGMLGLPRSDGVARAPEPHYTGTSFSEPITRVAQAVLRMETTRTETAFAAGASNWPERMSWSSHVADRVLSATYQPVFALVNRIGASIRAAHKPRVTTSIDYILLTVLLLLGLLFMPARSHGALLTGPSRAEALPLPMATS